MLVLFLWRTLTNTGGVGNGEGLTEMDGSLPSPLLLLGGRVKGLPLNAKVEKVLRGKGMPSDAENLRDKE